MVRTSVDDWTLTSWRQINVDDMDLELRRFLKDIRTLDKGKWLCIAFLHRTHCVKK